MNQQPLLDSELEIVHEILERFGDKRAMNLEQLYGFLTAVLCGPDDVPESEYLREIWGHDVVKQDVFAGQPLLKQFVELVRRHRDAISYTLQSGDYPEVLVTERACNACRQGRRVPSCLTWPISEPG